jgi:hypothetical protein
MENEDLVGHRRLNALDYPTSNISAQLRKFSELTCMTVLVHEQRFSCHTVYVFYIVGIAMFSGYCHLIMTELYKFF